MNIAVYEILYNRVYACISSNPLNPDLSFCRKYTSCILHGIFLFPISQPCLALCIIEQLLLNERPLSGAGLVAGIASGSSGVFILLACSFSILIYKWYKRRHSRVIPITQSTMRKLSADLERNEGKGPDLNYPNPNLTADAKYFCPWGKPFYELKISLVFSLFCS